MYLFVWVSGEARQFRENLAVYDITAAKTGVLNIYRFDAGAGFMRLVFDQEKLCWVPVPAGKTLSANGVRVHSS